MRLHARLYRVRFTTKGERGGARGESGRYPQTDLPPHRHRIGLTAFNAA